mgnify:CR=1 FL=1
MKRSIGLVALALAMTSCNGIFSGLYDEVEAALPFGFIQVNEADDSGTIYIDARDYEKWTYISLKDKSVDTANMVKEEPEPSRWDFALHRYDVKTNQGAARETEFLTMDALKAHGHYDEGLFVADTAGRVVVDMSTMMEGYLGYHASNVNKVLSRWLNVDTSTMPPIYTMSGKVYLLRLADGTFAALLFTDFMDESSVKGYITIKYIYPL